MAIIELQKFSEYSSKIQDDVNNVDAVVFAGVVLNKNLYVHFDILIDSSIYRVVFTILPEGNAEYSAFEDIYEDVLPNSIIDIAGELGKSYRAMVVVSSFKKHYHDSVYSLFCAVNDDEVYEIIFNKGQFLYMSDILDNILHFNIVTRTTSLRLLRFCNMEMETLKISTPLFYTPENGITEFFVNKHSLAPRKFLDTKALVGGVVFLPISNSTFGDTKWMLLPITLSRRDYKKMIRNCRDMVLESLDELDNNMDRLAKQAGGEDNLLILEEFIHAPFSRKSDYPMDRTTFVVGTKDGRRMYVDINTNIFNNFRKDTTKRLIDGV